MGRAAMNKCALVGAIFTAVYLWFDELCCATTQQEEDVEDETLAGF
jgi:hypothetical protein